LLNSSGFCQNAKWLTPGQNLELGAGNEFRHLLCMRAFDAFVMLAVGDHRRYGDLGELLRLVVRLRCPHVADLLDEGVVFLRRRRQTLIVLADLLDVTAEGGVGGDILAQATDIVIGPEGIELGQSLGMVHGDVEADDSAVAPADQRGLVDLEIVHECDDVGGHQRVTVGLRGARAAAMAAAVGRDYLEVFCEGRDLVAPDIGMGEAAMQHD
jgi:hypothetical protein